MRTRTKLGAAGALLAAVLLAATAQPAAANPATHGSPRSAGCGATPAIAPGTSTTITLESGGIARTAVVSVPAGYQAHKSTPVILAFHGRGSTGALIQEFSGLSALPAITVFPDGIPTTGSQSWQGAPYEAPGVDDVRFTDDLLDALEAGYCVDTRRVFATGKSNGGGFVSLLACTSADRIAAFAPVAGAYYPGTDEGCDDASAPILEFHGTGDATMKYGGGISHGSPYVSVPTWLATWAERNGCEASVTEPLTSDTTLTRWEGCDRGEDLAHIAIADGGHTWPGALAYSGGGYTTQTISAADIMWRFFQAHPLRG